MRMFSTLSNFIELLLQARCVADAKAQRIAEAQVRVDDGFPALGKLPDWKARKVHEAAARLSMDALRELVAQVNRLQRIMYPTGDEDYVPNWEDYFETLVVRLTAARK